MNDSTIFLILGLCGLGVVVLGLLIFLFSVIFRFTGRNFMGFLSLLARDKEEGEKPSVIPHARPNLRAIADAQDFDAALAKHVVQDEGVITQSQIQAQANAAQSPLPPTSPPLTAPAPGFDDLSSQIAASRRRLADVRRRPNVDDEEDDLLGGIGGLMDDQP